MRKLSLLILSVIFVLTSCRKEADYVPFIGETSQIAYTTYTEQFKVLWNNINTGYVFWDVDKTDWDEVYEKYVPEFENLDARIKDGGKVTTSELKTLYQNSMGTLIDHHMTISIRNIYPNYGENDRFSFMPGSKEVQSRSYYHDMNETLEEISSFQEDIINEVYSEYTIKNAAMESGLLSNGIELAVCYILFELPDGKQVPYLWQNAYFISSIMNQDINADTSSFEYKVADLYDLWYADIIETPADSLGGVILDNRCNFGGEVNDLQYVVGLFSEQPFSPIQARYKEGSGRLEHSVWIDHTVKPFDSKLVRDLEKENIPYVVLSNLYSISMGEITSYAISQLPTGYIIGERTYGATGTLEDDNMSSLTYGGPFGHQEREYHYVYTSTFELKFDGDFIPEGIGISPDKELLTNEVGVKGQLDAAFEYIKNYK